MRTPFFVVCVGVVAGCATFSAAQSDSSNGQSLGDVARQLRQQKAGLTLAGPATMNHPQPSGLQPAPETAPAESVADAARRARQQQGTDQFHLSVSDPAEREYEVGIRQLFIKEDFKALDDAAAEARTTKARLPGGAWKLFDFYYALTDPLRGDRASDGEWQAHIATIKRWVAERPQSVSARIVLAEAYFGYGMFARGGGYANSVTDDGWRLLGERLKLAIGTLVDAYNLPDKDPYWFEAMQHVGLVGGMDNQTLRELLEKAIAAEPTFYHFYREYANSLLPKWNGEPGDAESFAEEMYKRVGGDEGKFLYFELATTIYCTCSNEPRPLQMSWDRIKQGYAVLSSTYGTTNLKRNRYASLAYMAGDRAVAHQMFAEIGDAWEPQTWRSKAQFDAAKAWAQ